MRRMASLIALALAASAPFAGAAFAANAADGAPADVQRMSVAELAAKLEADGYTVREVEMEGRGYEVKAVDAEGRRVEMRLDAAGQPAPYREDD